MVAIWAVYAVMWHYLTFFVYKDSSPLVCRAIAGLPIIKVRDAAVSKIQLVFFWKVFTIANLTVMC